MAAVGQIFDYASCFFEPVQSVGEVNGRKSGLCDRLGYTYNSL